MKKLWIPLVILIAWLPFLIAAWDNDKPGDNQAWNDAAGSIRDNWDALEVVLGVDLSGAENIFNIKNATYGALGDGSTDDATAIQAAIDAAEAVNGMVYIPRGIYIFKTGLTVQANITIVGEDEIGSVLKKDGDITGITLTYGATLRDFTLDAGGNTLGGIKVTGGTGKRHRFSRLLIQNQGGIGLEITNSNNGTFEDITLISNGSDGVKIIDASQGNVNIFKNIDARSNTGIGFNIDTDCEANLGFGIVCQSNTGGGIRINSAANIIFGYAEGNGGIEWELTSDDETKGNICFLLNVAGNITDSSPYDQSNLIIGVAGSSVGGAQMAGIKGDLRATNFRLQNFSKTGTLEMKHDDTDAQFDFVVRDAGTDQTLAMGNIYRKLTVTDLTTGPTKDSIITGDSTGATMVVTSSDTTAETISGHLANTSSTEFTTADTISGGSAAGTLTVTAVTTKYLNVTTDGNLTVGRVLLPNVVIFTDSDATPKVNESNSFISNTSGVTITRFDNCVAGQVFNIISKGAIVYDTSTANRLIGSSTDITTASGDTTMWVCETGGTTASVCRLLNWVDVSQNNSSASEGIYGQ